MNSFLPRTISNWNALPQQTKLATSPESFKHKIKKQTKPPTYYNSGTRKGQILHARLRMECSDLNHHLVIRHIQENSNAISVEQLLKHLNIIYFSAPLMMFRGIK